MLVFQDYKNYVISIIIFFRVQNKCLKNTYNIQTNNMK